MPNSTSNQLYKIQKTKALYISSDLLRLFSKHSKIGTSLVVQWLRLYASNAGGAGSIPGWGTKIPHATGHKHSKITVPLSSQNCFVQSGGNLNPGNGSTEPHVGATPSPFFSQFSPLSGCERKEKSLGFTRRIRKPVSVCPISGDCNQ